MLSRSKSESDEDVGAWHFDLDRLVWMNRGTVSISRQDNSPLLPHRMLASTIPSSGVQGRIGPINAVQA
ncbi:MAG: hypothetical protein CMJ77_23070 [Planctomycetaceae bacterium]|nr:hypothetical protein [Planctomycetaceae bacterium]